MTTENKRMFNMLMLRKKKHLTQRDLALKVGVSRNMIARYENGTSNPPIDKLILIAKYLETTTDYLLQE